MAQGIPWPRAFPGRALANEFTARWHGRERELEGDEVAKRGLEEAKASEDWSNAFVYAGQSVGLVERIEPAAAIVRRIVEDAETHLRAARAAIR